MEQSIIKVYVDVDGNNIITKISSNLFINDLTNWIQIDEGYGDKYAHAQGNYLDKGLLDSNGKYNYKLVDGIHVELTEEEKEKLFPTQQPQPTQEETLRAKILKDNADMQLQLAQQQKINANLLAQIAKLGGTQ